MAKKRAKKAKAAHKIKRSPNVHFMQAMIIGVLAAILGFVYAWQYNSWRGRTFLSAAWDSFFGSLLFGLLFFIAALILFYSFNSAIRLKAVKKWQWVFYTLGWILGIWNILFWVIMVVLHMIFNKGQHFFNKDLHKRIYVWGIVATILLIMAVVYFTFFPV